MRSIKSICLIILILSILFTSCKGKEREAADMPGNSSSYGTGAIDRSDGAELTVTPALQAGDFSNDAPGSGENGNTGQPRESKPSEHPDANGAQAPGEPGQQPEADNVRFPEIKGVSAQMQDAAFWIGRFSSADNIILSDSGINEYNSANFQWLSFLNDPADQTENLSGEEVKKWINSLSVPSSSVRYDENGKQYQKSDYDQLKQNLNLQNIPASVTARYGVTVKRVLMRTWPSQAGSFSKPSDRRIDYFVETAAYPAEPVVVYHTSADGQWLFAGIYNYRAWIPADAVAFCTREELNALRTYPDKLIVIGAKIFTPKAEDSRISEIQLDMGVALPLAAKDEREYTVRFPARDSSGRLEYVGLKLPISSDLSEGYLNYTTANVLTQAFKFLGEPYGWGGMNNARDCSAFLLDNYRTFSIRLPRNSDQQEQVRGAIKLEGKDRAERLRILESLRPGSTLYMPGHAMMYLGEYEGRHYIIHDVTSVYEKGQGGELKQIPLNQAVVTPLDVYNSKGTEYIMLLTSAVQID